MNAYANVRGLKHDVCSSTSDSGIPILYFRSFGMFKSTLFTFFFFVFALNSKQIANSALTYARY